jgi:hypothetical protein
MPSVYTKRIGIKQYFFCGLTLEVNRAVKQEDQQGEFCDASLTANIQNSRHQEEVLNTHHALRRD